MIHISPHNIQTRIGDRTKERPDVHVLADLGEQGFDVKFEAYDAEDCLYATVSFFKDAKEVLYGEFSHELTSNLVHILDFMGMCVERMSLDLIK